MRPLLTLLYWSAVNASATIVFLNLNDSPSEVEAARKTAITLGESFTVLPSEPLTDEERSTVKRLQSRIKEVSAKIERRLIRNPEKRDQKLEAELLNLVSQQKRAIPDTKKFNLNELNSLPEKESVNKLIVSGHSSGIDFSGLLGQITLTELKAQGLRNVKSAYLLGCYTMTPAAALWWQQNFPSIEFATGYLSKGFLSDAQANGRPLSADLLSELMTLEGRIRKTNDNEVIIKLMDQAQRKLRDANKSLAMLFQCRYYIPAEKKQAALNEIDSLICRNSEELLSSLHIALYLPYEQGRKPLPADNADSPLRSFYNTQQRLQKCGKALKHLPSIVQTLSLIKYPHVVDSFRRYYEEDLKRLQNVLGRLKTVEGCARTGSNLGQSPTAITESVEHLSTCINSLEKRSKGQTVTDSELKLLDTMQVRLSRLLLEKTCVPALIGNWIEPKERGLELGNPRSLPGCSDIP